MFGAAQTTMRRERPVEPRCAQGCRGVTPVSGLPGSPASRCPARERASRRGSNRLPGSDRRRCHRRIEQHLPTGAIAQEAYRKYTLTSITFRDPRAKSRLWTFSDNHSASEINTVETTRTCSRLGVEVTGRSRERPRLVAKRLDETSGTVSIILCACPCPTC